MLRLLLSRSGPVRSGGLNESDFSVKLQFCSVDSINKLTLFFKSLSLRSLFFRILSFRTFFSGFCLSEVCFLGLCLSEVCFSGVCLSELCFSGFVFQNFVFQKFVFRSLFFRSLSFRSSSWNSIHIRVKTITKELSFYYKLSFSYPFIFATHCLRTLNVQTLNSGRLHNLSLK